MEWRDLFTATSLSATFTGLSAVIAGWAIFEGRRLRSLQTDPHVIAYTDYIVRGSQVVALVIENIGSGPAHHISLSFHGRPLRFELWSRQQEELFILEHGIRFLAPGQLVKVPIGQFRSIDRSDVDVRVRYYKSSTQYEKNAVEETFSIRLREYLGTLVESDPTVDALKEIRKAISGLDHTVEKLRPRQRWGSDSGPLNTDL